MVRFILYAIEMREHSYIFKFHYGKIHIRVYFVSPDVFNSLNSTMVRFIYLYADYTIIDINL